MPRRLIDSGALMAFVWLVVHHDPNPGFQALVMSALKVGVEIVSGGAANFVVTRVTLPTVCLAFQMIATLMTSKITREAKKSPAFMHGLIYQQRLQNLMCICLP